MNIYSNLAMRSLNQVKTINPIMYLAIRCFFEDFTESAVKNNLFADFIKRKLQVRQHWSTKKNKLFKEKNAGKYIYRDTLSLSPFGIIAESYLMRIISQQFYFEDIDYVYSYNLPFRINSTRNYTYYFDGYKKRNNDIMNVLESDKDLIAVVLDLEKFYPSINIEIVKKLFFKKINSTLDNTIYDLAKNLISSILEQSLKGVPIGMDLSHLMAQVYLEELDDKLAEKFPKKYFRYVDDIIIICDKSDKESVIEFVRTNLPDKLNINEKKTDELNFDEWSLLHQSHDMEEGNLNEVLNFITAYISMHPSKIDSLEKDIKALGCSIPLSRIKKQAKSKSFMSYIKSLLKNHRRYSMFEIYFAKNEYIVTQLINLQKFYLIKLNKLLQLNYDNSSSAENRANTQQLKYILNRLLYLSTIEDLSRIRDAIPLTEKFEDTLEVINALVSKDLTNAIQYGGKVIQTICELWIENKFDVIELNKEYFVRIENINDVLDSIIILYLYKIIKFDLIEILDFLNEYNKEYVYVVLDDKYVVQNKQNDFLLEIQGLLQGRNLETKHNLLITRYDNDESIQLAGLNLGLTYS